MGTLDAGWPVAVSCMPVSASTRCEGGGACQRWCCHASPEPPPPPVVAWTACRLPTAAGIGSLGGAPGGVGSASTTRLLPAATATASLGGADGGPDVASTARVMVTAAGRASLGGAVGRGAGCAAVPALARFACSAAAFFFCTCSARRFLPRSLSSALLARCLAWRASTLSVHAFLARASLHWPSASYPLAVHGDAGPRPEDF